MSDKKSANLIYKFIELISPSTISSIFCVVISIVIDLGVLFLNRYRPGRLELSSASSHLTIKNSHLVGTLTDDRWVKDLPHLFLYLSILLLIYFAVFELVEVINSELKAIKFIWHLLERVVVVIVWYPYLLFFFNNILPYVAKIAIVSTSASNVFLIVCYVIFSIAITSIAVHINIILLRLLSLKTRIFSI